MHVGPAQEPQPLNAERLARVAGLSTAVTAQQHNSPEECIHQILLTYAAGFSFLHSIKNITSALNNFLDRMEINYLITFYMVVIYDWTQRQKVGT